jgi:aryl-alcohol dehydrogenase-like predicted oxidoreductase
LARDRSSWGEQLDADVASGNTGSAGVALCLGTMTFGLQCDEPDLVSRSWTRRPNPASPSSTRRTSYPLGGTVDITGRTEESRRQVAARQARPTYILATKCSGKTARRRGSRHLAQARARRDRCFPQAGSAPITSDCIKCTITIP